MFGGSQVIAADLLVPEINQRVLGFLERIQDGLFVAGQLAVGAGVGGLDAGQNVAEVQSCPGDARAKGVGVRAALGEAGELAGLYAEVAVEADTREKFTGLNADARSGCGQSGRPREFNGGRAGPGCLAPRLSCPAAARFHMSN